MKPTVPEVLPHVRAVYERSAVGCCLHIVLDDDNVQDSDVDECILRAEDQEHEECGRLARLLRQMSRTQRHKLARVR